MDLTREIVAEKWNSIVRNRLPTDKGSNDWVWRLVQWATTTQAAEIERLRIEVDCLEQQNDNLRESLGWKAQPT